MVQSASGWTQVALVLFKSMDAYKEKKRKLLPRVM